MLQPPALRSWVGLPVLYWTRSPTATIFFISCNVPGPLQCYITLLVCSQAQMREPGSKRSRWMWLLGAAYINANPFPAKPGAQPASREHNSSLDFVKFSLQDTDKFPLIFSKYLWTLYPRIKVPLKPSYAVCTCSPPFSFAQLNVAPPTYTAGKGVFPFLMFA